MADVEETVRAAVSAHRGRRGPLLPILHDVQEWLGWIPPAAIPLLAEGLNLSRAEVHGVVTFYEDFRTEPPPGGTRVRVCRAEACQAQGAERTFEHARTVPGIALEQVFCLGNCALGPSAEIAGRLHGRVTPERLEALTR